MHTARRLFAALLLVLPLACPAWATKITVGDPTAAVTVTPITDGDIPFDVDFGSCAGLGSFSSNMGCFAFYNDTSSAWTSITLTLTMGSPSGGAFTCASDTYSNLNCRNKNVLTFSGGEIPNNQPLQTFVIAEDDLDPSSIGFSANVTFASTPEPPGITLLGTGLLSAGMLFWVRRHRSA